MHYKWKYPECFSLQNPVIQGNRKGDLPHFLPTQPWNSMNWAENKSFAVNSYFMCYIPHKLQFNFADSKLQLEGKLCTCHKTWSAVEVLGTELVLLTNLAVSLPVFPCVRWHSGPGNTSQAFTRRGCLTWLLFCDPHSFSGETPTQMFTELLAGRWGEHSVALWTATELEGQEENTEKTLG